MEAVHYVMLVLTCLVACCPIIGQQEPSLAPMCSVLASVSGALLGVLAQISHAAPGMGSGKRTPAQLTPSPTPTP